MIRYIDGDILKSKEDIIIHGVNCQRVMAAGVAARIAARWPVVRKEYLSRDWALGDVQWVEVSTDENPRYVVNAATQQFYGRHGVFVSYSALCTVFMKVIAECRERGLTLSAPKVGAGLAGGDWITIEGIITSVSTDFPVHIYRIAP